MEWRKYQEDLVNKGGKIITQSNFVYLAMEVRTGKTLTSLGIADSQNPSNVLFLTKKKAMSSILFDYNLLQPKFELTVINYESIHKLPDIYWDVVILDEAHSMGAFPKPSKRSKQVKGLITNCEPKVILLSGTPTPESYSQMYHQVWGIPNNPFNKYKSFYKFAKDYVKVKTKMINGFKINDYSDGSPEIINKMAPFTIRYSQKEAGFKSVINEHFLTVPMSKLTYKLTEKLKKDLVIEGKDNAILADTPVKLMMKLHQMFSGTVKFESGESTILDLSKAEYILNYFKDRKIGIFYKFTEELNALRKVYGDRLTTDLADFDSGDKVIALQIVSGREGISLRNAEVLVFFNIDFSATSYWQARDRMTTKERPSNEVYWVFSEGGIEWKIYKAVKGKKKYTLSHFKRDYGIRRG